MKLSEALFKAGDSMFEDRDLRDLLREASALAKRVEVAPIGSITDGGRDWIFYSQSGDVEEILAKRVAIVSIQEEGE